MTTIATDAPRVPLSQIQVGRWFHDLELGIEGKVLAQGVNVTVALRRPRPIVIRGEQVGLRQFERTTVAAGWEVLPGRLPKEAGDA